MVEVQFAVLRYWKCHETTVEYHIKRCAQQCLDGYWLLSCNSLHIG